MGGSSRSSTSSAATRSVVTERERIEVDIIITATRADVRSFLSSWKPVFRLPRRHLIIVQDSSITTQLLIPTDFDDAVDYEIFTQRDAESFFASCSSSSSSSKSLSAKPQVLLNPFRGNACRSFGFLMSRARYIFSIDGEALPAKDEATGDLIDPIQQHLSNLSTPSTPFFFNTLYDPYRDGTDFVRGYPFSLRLGVPTALSHGSALNAPDYDAPTLLVKPNERITLYVDALLTVPKNSLFPLNSTNLAFDRHRIGAAMFIGISHLDHGLNSIDDIWAGFCCKVICDHLAYGVKIGIPYVWREKKKKVSGGDTLIKELRSEFKSMLWLEEIVPFFQSIRLPKTSTTAIECYADIAKMVRSKLRLLDPAFEKVASSMEAWVEAWKYASVLSASSP